MLRSFAPPVFATPEETLRANILHLVIGATVLIVVGFLPLIVIMQPGTMSRGAPAAAFICCLGLSLLHLNRSGRTRLAAILFAGGLIALMTRGKGQHFMYIDDEQGLGSAMIRALKLLGYRCTFYSDARVALDAFRSDPDQFDAVISDMTMPFLSGFDVVKELHDIRPDLPVALTSGRSDEGTHAFAYSLGIKTWISKPTTIDELSHTLKLLLRSAGR